MADAANEDLQVRNTRGRLEQIRRLCMEVASEVQDAFDEADKARDGAALLDEDFLSAIDSNLRAALRTSDAIQ